MSNRVHYLCAILAAVLILGATPLLAIPSSMSFQGFLKNADGTTVSGSIYTVFSIYDSPTGGVPVWGQTSTLSVANGRFKTKLNGLSPSVFPYGQDRYMGIKVGSRAELPTRIQFLPVPISYYAEEAASCNSTSINHLIKQGGGNSDSAALYVDSSGNVNIGLGNTSTIYKLDLGGQKLKVSGTLASAVTTINLSSSDTTATLDLAVSRTFLIRLASGSGHTLTILFANSAYNVNEYRVIFDNSNGGEYGISWPSDVNWSCSNSYSAAPDPGKYGEVLLYYTGYSTTTDFTGSFRTR